MTDDNSTFLREVEQEVRRERMMRLLDRYGVPALIVLGVLLLGFGGYTLYANSAREAAERDANTFIVAERLLRDDKTDDARKDFERLANSGSGAYVPLAKMRLAAIALENGKPAEAKKLFDEVANTDGFDEKLRRHAALQSITLEIDKLSFDDAKARLNGFMGEADTWRHSARELLALAALRENQLADARQILTQLLTDQGAPQTIRQRAQILMAIASKEPAKKGAAAKDQTPASATPKQDAEAKPKDGAAPSGTRATGQAEAKSGAAKTADKPSPETPPKTAQSGEPAKADAAAGASGNAAKPPAGNTN